MPLYAVLARENFPLRMMGTIIGAIAMAGSLRMATCPLICGWIFDTYGTLAWLYVVSFVIGLAGALIPVMYTPIRKKGVLGS